MWIEASSYLTLHLLKLIAHKVSVFLFVGYSLYITRIVCAIEGTTGRLHTRVNDVILFN